MEKNYDDIKNKLLLRAEQERLERNVMLIDHWNNLKPFKTPNDVPNIPVVDHTKYHEFFVPRLIAAGAIPKTELIDNQVYIGEHRRCNVAIWDAKENVFKYNRNKFGQVFIDKCNHFEDDNGFALFVPIKLGTVEDFEKTK